MTGSRKHSLFVPLPEPGDDSGSLSSLTVKGIAAFASICIGVPATGVPSTPNNGYKIPCTDIYIKHISQDAGYRIVAGEVEDAVVTVDERADEIPAQKKWQRKGLRLKIGNPHARRLFSGGIAGALSRTMVAPLETIRTHLMVGSSGNSMPEVFRSIMDAEGWTGLFRGNLVNVVRVTPNKAIELFAYDTAKKALTPKDGEPRKLPIPIPSSVLAGAFAGFSSTLCTYPLELIKTRLTIQRGLYDNFLHAFAKIVQEEGPAGLYRGLAPSLLGVMPYAAANYFTYDTLKRLYKKVSKKEEIGNVATLLIGSASAAISSSSTFPLEIARKQMQVGAIGGRPVYKNMLDALVSILEKEGAAGLYRGLGPSCMKLVPAAGISFMCYEACKKLLLDEGGQ